MRPRVASQFVWPGLGLLIGVLAAWWIRAPGYMDADYYYANARQIAQGSGLQEPFLWNYLDDPAGLPHPSFLYWMPLASFVSAASMAIGGVGFRSAQAPYLLATAAVPALTAVLAARFSSDKTGIRQAAALAIFPGFFLPFFVTTDSFSIYALIGAGALAVMASAAQGGPRTRWLAAGVLVGLAHLTRADGVLLLAPGLVAAVLSKERRVSSVSLIFVGYLAIMTPWWARNGLAVGSPLPEGLNRTLWLLRYDELFSFPATILTAERWWGAGLGVLLKSRLESLLANLQSLIAVNGLVFLGPFMLIGALEKKSDPLVRLTAVYLFLLLGMMSFVFPFAGSRGGFFHSSTAFMPILWALTPLGINRVVRWAAGRRGWVVERAQSLFGWSAPVLAGVLTAVLFWTRIVGGSPMSPAWSGPANAYAAVSQNLEHLDPTRSVVAANNPPGLYLASGAPSVMIPNGPPEALQAVVEKYAVRWVVLDANRPDGLAVLYRAPDTLPWLMLARRIEWEPEGDILIFRVIATEGEGGQ